MFQYIDSLKKDFFGFRNIVISDKSLMYWFDGESGVD